MTTDGYYRYPAIYKNNVVFVTEDDLWLSSARGGVARRLTANLGMTSHPAFSPDGKLLAFIGREDGGTEVYVMPAVGGPATRLTYLGGSTAVLGWTPDGDIVFRSDAGLPFRQLTKLYTISPDGEHPDVLPYGPARSISFGPDGHVVLGRRAQELAYWKRYRGGTTGDIWIDTQGKGRFKPLLKLKSNLVSPLWLGDRIYFLSDHEGIGNLYSCTVRGTKVKRHTHHTNYYVRQPTTDGHRIVYQAGADLYIFDPTKEETKDQSVHQVKIKLHSPRVQRNRKFVEAASYIGDYILHPDGHSVAMTVRGKAFSFANWDGAVLQYGQAHGVRYRLAEWLNDGKRLVMISDTNGEETIEIHSDASQALTKQAVEQLDGLDIGRAVFLKVSPQKDAVILANHRYELIHVDLQNKTLKVLDKSNFSRIAGADWSPDGRWVVYGFSTSRHSCAIKLYNLESDEIYFVTPPNTLYDVGPSFDPEGNYIYFISYRDFDPVHDSHYFDLNFPRGSRPYLVTLQKDLPNPFIPRPNHSTPENNNNNNNNNNKNNKPKDAGTNAKNKEQNGSEKTQQKTNGNEQTSSQNGEKLTQIDLEGIQTRIAAFPVSEGRYRQVKGIKGKALFTSFPLEGSLNSHWLNNNNDGKGALEVYDFSEQKKEFIVKGISNFDLSRDRKYILYRSNKNLRVLKAGEKPDNKAVGYTKKSGWIKLKRLRIAINPPNEWQQMFREAWRLQRDHFWTEDMSSIDWKAVYKRYYLLIERVATRSEFSDLLWEMQGELGTSHAYELGGDYRSSPRYQQGFLGADFEYNPDANGYQITHIVQGDTWLEKSDSPLNRLGTNISVGDVILAINGRQLSDDVSPQQVLVNQAGTEIQLTVVSANGANEAKQAVNNGNQNSEPWTVLVKTLSNETQARYREWVENNRQRVHQETRGRVGYVHIPDMGSFGYAEFHRYYRTESEREGLIVDVRFNGGGNVSQLLLEKLARRRLGYKKPRYGEVWPYPAYAVLGPMVALTNEYAGSDGDIFSHAFKLLGLGPLIGKRTWGGVVGIWPRHSLVDGTTTTQPEFSTWFEDVGWDIENYGTDPDIEVDIKPQDYAQGKDPQLNYGLKEILKQLKENPPSIPGFGPKPSRALPKLPKIKGRKK